MDSIRTQPREGQRSYTFSMLPQRPLGRDFNLLRRQDSVVAKVCKNAERSSMLHAARTTFNSTQNGAQGLQ